MIKWDGYIPERRYAIFNDLLRGLNQLILTDDSGEVYYLSSSVLDSILSDYMFKVVKKRVRTHVVECLLKDIFLEGEQC